MIFVDSNVPMYLVGADHPHKADARRILERLISDRLRLVTDAEVFQEILRRFVAIEQRDAIQPTFDALRSSVDEVFPVEEADILVAKDLVGTHAGISARDALHVAIMRGHGISRLLSFDQGFDAIAGIDRVGLD